MLKSELRKLIREEITRAKNISKRRNLREEQEDNQINKLLIAAYTRAFSTKGVSKLNDELENEFGLDFGTTATKLSEYIAAIREFNWDQEFKIMPEIRDVRAAIKRSIGGVN